MVDYSDRSWYVEPSLHLWDVADLIMVDDFSDVFLDSICQYFIECFCINVYEGDWSVILFLSNVLVWLGYQSNCSIIKKKRSNASSVSIV